MSKSRENPPAGRTPTQPSSTGWQPSITHASQPTYSGSSYSGSSYSGSSHGDSSYSGSSYRRAAAVSGSGLGRPWRRRVVGGALALAATAVAAVFLARSADDLLPAELTPLAPEPVAILEIVRGSVRLTSPDAAASAVLAAESRSGDTAIPAGAVVETGADGERPRDLPYGHGGRAAFRLAGGESVRLDEGSRVRLASSSALVLEHGAVYVDATAGAGVEVRTTLGVVRDIGTQFEVRLLPGDEAAAGGRLRVRVREGLVVLRQDGGARHEAAAGVELSLGTDGRVERGVTPVHGEAWNWVVDAAPVPDMEGRPLHAFLDWMARERGWELSYLDSQTAQLAEEIVLHGDVSGLSATDAATMVFGGSGLHFRIEDGVLAVAPGPPPAAASPRAIES